VAPETVKALRELKATGRKLILVTGRDLADLKGAFPELELFDRVVAENGALIHNPADAGEKTLGHPPPPEFIQALRNRNVTPLHLGRIIVATREPHEETVLEAIREFGLEHQVIFNKGAVMILPSGVNKATGLSEALAQLKLSPANTVAVGDAENDNAMLELCECAAAVSNALPRLKERADLVTAGEAGEGVSELAGRLIAADLQELAPKLSRHWITIGHRADGSSVRLDPYARAVLLAGASVAGKSIFASAFLEALTGGGYQFFVLDPEGDYGGFGEAVVLGDAHVPPSANELVRVLETPGHSVVASTLAIPFPDRPAFFHSLLPHLIDLRRSGGRPHWIVIDEAHHLMPNAPTAALRPEFQPDTHGIFLITVEPEHVNLDLLRLVDWVFAIDEAPEAVLERFAEALGEDWPASPGPHNLERGEALVWRRDGSEPPFRMRIIPRPPLSPFA